METRKIPTIDIIKTGHRIRELRKERGLKLVDISGILNISYMAVFKWEKGISIPCIDNLIALAYIFDTTIDNIIVLNEE